MTDRPTPAEVIEGCVTGSGSYVGPVAAHSAIEALAAHGYRIVHPDDVPVKDPNDHNYPAGHYFALGWNSCRSHLVGDES